jgi:hypothetical protein
VEIVLKNPSPMQGLFEKNNVKSITYVKYEMFKYEPLRIKPVPQSQPELTSRKGGYRCGQSLN